MSNSCDSKWILNSCHPYVTIGCIISCFLCTVVMIWWVYAMRVDMERMEKMMQTSHVSSMQSPMSHNMSSMDDMMDMSMRDMWMMLEWKTGDDLDRAFLEGMIPHHQWAVEMAKYLVNAKHPELQKMWQEIISAQQKEINQMKQWMIDWGYTSQSSDPKDEMMRDHCKSMPNMPGCEKYR